jgi:hypothetical protein
MSGLFWKKMPCSWQKDPNFHSQLKTAPAGTAIAALKLYLALCLKANYEKKDHFPYAGCVQRTITQLGDIVDMSRPMVIRGLTLLKAMDVIEVVLKRPAMYRIKEYDTAPYWTKLPRAHLFGGAKEEAITAINAMGNRGKSVLQALQLYLYLASIRDKDTQRANVSYTQMDMVLGVTRNEVSRAISALVNHDLITVRPGEMTPQARRLPGNVYWLRGSDKDPTRDAIAQIIKRNQDAQSSAVQIDFGSED